MADTPRTIRELIDCAAGARPNKAAFIDPENGQQITYLTLRASCIELERRFERDGLKFGDVAAFLSENSIFLVEHLLASMYVGLVPAPLSLLEAPERLSAVLKHCNAKVVYASNPQHGLAAAAAEACEDRVRVELLKTVSHGQIRASTSGTDTQRFLSGSDAGLLIYTSGTTARPRGALFNHTNLLACAANTATSHVLSEHDRLLTVLPLYHMNAVDRLLNTVWTQGSAVLAPKFQLDRYWDWVAQYRCTWLSLVPTIVAQLNSRARPTRDALASVRYARSSSAPLPAAHRELFEAKFGIPILEGMGMTEAGTLFMNPPPPGRCKAGSVGVSCGFEVKVLDPKGQLLPAGQSGSIWVRGPAIMRGYYGEPELTAKSIDADGWLNTGDLGRLDNDAYLFLTGRTKEIIIKSGINIAPHEVDDALLRHPSVGEAATVGVADSVVGEDIVAYVVPKPEMHCDAAELIDFCRERLGNFKTPRRIFVVDDLPRGPSGKVQRLKVAATSLEEQMQEPNLSDSAVLSPYTNGSSVAAPDGSAARIAQLWGEILSRKDIHPDDDFFAIGGTSLLATELIMRMEREFGVELSLEKILLHATVSAQVKLLEHAVNEVRRAFLLAPIREGCRKPPLFCIHGVALYRALAVALGPEQPAYGLSPNLVIDLRTAQLKDHLGLNDIAERYLDALREVQPHGPYYLTGFSFGGRVALEVARRLREASEEVAMLSVIDTYLCCVGWRYNLHWFGHHVGQVLRHGAKHIRECARHAQKLRRPEVRATYVEAQLRRHARNGYRARPYSGNITLFRALDRYAPAYSMDEYLGWRDITRGTLDVHDVPGDHYSMLNPPNVETLAQKLRTYLPT